MPFTSGLPIQTPPPFTGPATPTPTPLAGAPTPYATPVPTPTPLGIPQSAQVTVGPAGGTAAVGLPGYATVSIAFPPSTGTSTTFEVFAMPALICSEPNGGGPCPAGPPAVLYLQISSAQNVRLMGMPSFAVSVPISGVAFEQPGAQTWDSTSYVAGPGGQYRASGQLTLSAYADITYALLTPTQP
jgi:hypothetical protein